ncbi:MAG: TonB family protein [Dysgonamonadaceae bacterium]|jgi:TonB family protein|nr:TonB family protein [Dysgonamonadaceae bacterium]
MDATKEKIYGIAGSMLLCAALLFVLYVTFLRTEIKPKEEGILVHFEADAPPGETVAAESEENGETPQEANPDLPAETKPAPITQNSEQTVAIEAAKAKQSRVEEEQRKRDAINKQVAGAFAGAFGDGRQGTEQTASQSNPKTAPATRSGGGGYGDFNLSGRTLAEGLPKPVYSASEEGNIVVNIMVDPRGNVIVAEIGKGTTINNGAMRRSALDAARKAKFSSIKGNNNQSGTVTYRYYLR